jgi:hypothetical protein
MAIPAIKSRRGPRRRKPAKLHADKAYDQADLRAGVREQGIAMRIARKGIESSQKLGKHRWGIERSIAWLFGYHRLATRYDCNANHFCAFLTPGATLTCYKKLARLPRETRSKRTRPHPSTPQITPTTAQVSSPSPTCAQLSELSTDCRQATH